MRNMICSMLVRPSFVLYEECAQRDRKVNDRPKGVSFHFNWINREMGITCCPLFSLFLDRNGKKKMEGYPSDFEKEKVALEKRVFFGNLGNTEGGGV